MTVPQQQGTAGRAPIAAGGGAARLRWLRWPLALLALLLVLLLAASLWATSPGSLRQGLQLAQRLLPAGQSLQFSDASGSLAGGGRIGRLLWSRPGTEVRVEGFVLDWSLRQLAGRQLHVRTLRADTVMVRLGPVPEAEPAVPFAMPDSLVLPLRLSVPLQLDQLELVRTTAAGEASTLRLGEIAAEYRYDGVRHQLRLQSLRHANSRLQATLQLHARELGLDGELAASLRDLVPGEPLALLAALQLEGSLAGGEAARIGLRLDAREQPHTDAPPAAGTLMESVAGLGTVLEELAATEQGLPAAPQGTQPPMQQDATPDGLARLHLQAVLHPWRDQPVQQLRLLFAGIDMRALHAAAPHSALGGELQLQPEADADPATHTLLLELRNTMPGAWDGGQLPVSSLSLRGVVAAEALHIRAAQLDLAGDRPAGRVELTGTLPWPQPGAAAAQLRLRQLDLQPLAASLPLTLLDGELSIEPMPAAGSEAATGDRWQLRASLTNARAGPLDQQRLPLDGLLAGLRIAPGALTLETLQARIGAGVVQLRGAYDAAGATLQVQGELQRLPLRSIHRRLAGGLASELSGSLSASGNLRQQLQFALDIASDAAGATRQGGRAEWEIRALQASGEWTPARLRIERVHVDAFEARIDGSDIQLQLPGMDALRARLDVRVPGLVLEADTSMEPLQGEGRVALQIGSADRLVSWLQGLPVIGARLPGLQAGGSGEMRAEWRGGWQQWLDGLELPGEQPQLHVAASASAPQLWVELAAARAGHPPTRLQLDELDLRLQGNLSAASLLLAGQLQAAGADARIDAALQVTGQPAAEGKPNWRLVLQRLVAAASLPDQPRPWRLEVAEGLQLELLGGDELELRSSAGTASLFPPDGLVAGDVPLQLAWQPQLLRVAAEGMQLQSSGTIRGLQPGWLDVLQLAAGEGPLRRAGLRSDLVFDGEWQIAAAQQLQVQARLARAGGDLWLLEPTDAAGPSWLAASTQQGVAAGFQGLQLQLQSVDENLRLALDWRTARAGVIDARLDTRLARRGASWSLPEDAPLTGTIRAQLQDVGLWGFLAPPGWRLQGALDADIALDGTRQSPRLQGDITGRQLGIRSVLDGIELHEGVLRASLQGERLQIDELTWQGGTGSRAYVRGLSGNRTQPPTDRGSMRVSGSIDWSGVAGASAGESGIELELQAQLARMQVLVRNDRQLSLSGGLSAALDEGALRVRGELAVDRASILLPEAGAPRLGDDVQVLHDAATDGATAAPPRGEMQTARPMDVQIQLDLGRDLALQGYGITTRLEGGLTVRSAGTGADPFNVVGEVRTDAGRFRAWGQALDVETGVVRFNGPYLNPSLNLLAIRPEIEVRAGVRVTGTLNAPRVQLYSDPPLPEAEALSWVVLGRPTALGGAEGTSMQQAALGLVAGGVGSSLAGGLGLDELGLAESGVSIGKRVSDQLYVTYQAGLSGAASTLHVFYDITRRLTLRGQTGEASAVDLIYTITYD